MNPAPRPTSPDFARRSAQVQPVDLATSPPPMGGRGRGQGGRTTNHPQPAPAQARSTRAPATSGGADRGIAEHLLRQLTKRAVLPLNNRGPDILVHAGDPSRAALSKRDWKHDLATLQQSYQTFDVIGRDRSSSEERRCRVRDLVRQPDQALASLLHRGQFPLIPGSLRHAHVSPDLHHHGYPSRRRRRADTCRNDRPLACHRREARSSARNSLRRRGGGLRITTPNSSAVSAHSSSDAHTNERGISAHHHRPQEDHQHD